LRWKEYLETVDLEVVELVAADLEAVYLEVADLEAADLEVVDWEAVDLEEVATGSGDSIHCLTWNCGNVES